MADNTFSYLGAILALFSDSFLFRSGIWCAALLFILWKAKMMRFSKELSVAIPGLKTSPFSIFGSLSTLPSRSVMKKLSLPVTAFIIQAISGHSEIFTKDKIFFFDLGPRRVVVLRKHEVVENLLKSNDWLHKGWVYDLLHPWLGTGLLTSTGSKWRSRRKLLTPSFHFDILKDFLPIIDEQSRILLNVFREKVHEEHVNIVIPITLCSLDIICDSTLGVHIGAQRNSESEYVLAVLRASQTVMDRMCNPQLWLDPVFHLSALGRQFKKDLTTLHTFTKNVIRQKKEALIQASELENEYDAQPKKKRKALMDLLIDHQMKHQDITEDDIREEVDTFTFEGHDTTSMGMSWALYLIGLYPHVQAQVQEELSNIFGDDVEREVTVDDLRDMQYLERVLKESQRLYPSVPMFGRHVEQDLDFCGYRIKKGSLFGVFSYSLHRDPEIFPDPEKFDPDRFLPENTKNRPPFGYVPFSAGPRNCIGQRFAILEEKVVIANILRNFHVKSLDHRDKIIITAELILRPAGPLRLKFTPRTSAAKSDS